MECAEVRGYGMHIFEDHFLVETIKSRKPARCSLPVKKVNWF